MDKFVCDFMINQKNFLEKHLDKNPIEICRLKSFQWRNDSKPNYSYSLHQHLYHLKYAYSYTFDYFLVYKFILDLLDHSERYYTLSIGCGGMLDKISLKYALCETDSHETMYIGIDKTNWNNEQILNFYKGIFINSDIGNVKRNRFISKIGIILFPRSLSEIQQSSLKKFIDRLHRDNFHNHICIASVPVSNGTNKLAEENKKLFWFTKEMAKKFKFNSSNALSNNIFTSKDFYDKHYKNSFKYPEEIKNWILEMSKYCIEPCTNKKEECSYIWKSPNTGLPPYDPIIYKLTK